MKISPGGDDLLVAGKNIKCSQVLAGTAILSKKAVPIGTTVLLLRLIYQMIVPLGLLPDDAG